MFDFESSRPEVSISKAAGTYTYAATADAIVCAYAVGDAPAQSWHADGAILDWDHAPHDLRAAFESRHDLRRVERELRCRDMELQHARISLSRRRSASSTRWFRPASPTCRPIFEGASRALGGAGKQTDGKKLIRLFCVEGAAPSEHPEEWQRFLAYARQDVEAMRDVYRRTRPLPRAEWEQYWAFEHINRRGVAVDLPFVRRAAALAAEDAVASRPPADRADRRDRHPASRRRSGSRPGCTISSPTRRCARC